MSLTDLQERIARCTLCAERFAVTETAHEPRPVVYPSTEARVMYRKALDIVPNEPSVLSNLGMSYLLTGDLRASETYLRKAIAQPAADSRVRQNLALVVGLQGRFQEAETIARGELPREEAEDNIAYLRQMLSQQNAWNLLKETDGQSQQ